MGRWSRIVVKYFWCKREEGRVATPDAGMLMRVFSAGRQAGRQASKMYDVLAVQI